MKIMNTINKDEELANNSTQPHSELPKVWKWERKKCVIEHAKVIDLLDDWGIGILNNKIVHRGDGIITLREFEEEKSQKGKGVWKQLYEYYLDNFENEDYEDPNILGVEKPDGNGYITKSEVRNALIEYGVFNKWVYLNNHFTDDKSILNNPKKSELYTPLFRDNKDEVFTFFKNGVVKTTKEGSELKPYEIVKDGYIWESKIRNEVDNIELTKDSEKGLFEEFVEKCMSVKNKDGKWEIDEKEYESLRTTYGYLLSNYTNNGETPAPIFVDRESDGVHAEGGNGKSLVMKSVKHFKSTSDINGKNVDKAQPKFTFSGVKLDSEFVFMDDVNVDFPFNIIYNFTTGPMEIERKGIDRFVIPENVKPKIGVCTNYIMSDTSFSTSRRQYVVEFGEFWNQKSKEGISVQKYLGKRLIDNEFSDNDWIQFYNFGFRCIREFLKKGVVETEKSNYERKQFIAKIEGDGVNDGVVDWIENYIKSNEVKFRDKVSWNTIYKDFSDDCESYVTENWKSTRLKQAVWDICLYHKWKYNPHKIGKTLSSKRWKSGPKGMQVDCVKIHIHKSI